MSNFFLFLTRLPLYLDVLLVRGRGFFSISLQFFPACRALVPVAEAGAMTTRTITLLVAW